MAGDATNPALSDGSDRSFQRRGQTKAPGSSPRPPRLRHPLPGSDTPNPGQLLGFPPAVTKEVGRTEGGVKEPGREAGGWGGAGDQVIRRIINLDGSLGGGEKKKKLQRLPDAGKEPEKAGSSA